MTIIQAQPLKTYGIFGPASSIDNEVPVFDGTTGKRIKAGSGLIISTNLMQATNKALLLEGDTGSTPTSGDGTRMMYIPAKQGAFRCGTVTDDQWDDVNIGISSVAFGYNGIASASYSAHFGQNGNVTGSHSTHFGNKGSVFSNYSTHFGYKGSVST